MEDQVRISRRLSLGALVARSRGARISPELVRT